MKIGCGKGSERESEEEGQEQVRRRRLSPVRDLGAGKRVGRRGWAGKRARRRGWRGELLLVAALYFECAASQNGSTRSRSLSQTREQPPPSTLPPFHSPFLTLPDQ